MQPRLKWDSNPRSLCWNEQMYFVPYITWWSWSARCVLNMRSVNSRGIVLHCEESTHLSVCFAYRTNALPTRITEGIRRDDFMDCERPQNNALMFCWGGVNVVENGEEAPYYYHSYGWHPVVSLKIVCYNRQSQLVSSSKLIFIETLTRYMFQSFHHHQELYKI